jgi:hypothetical protein
LGLDRISKLAQEAIDAATSKETLTSLGNALADKVKNRTRLGRGVKKDGAASHALPKLKEKTVVNRKRLKERGKLTGPGATPAKSGINRTGTTLESMTSKVTQNSIEIKLDSSGERVTKELIGLSDEFTFMNLSKPEIKFAESFIENAINKVLKGQ